MASKVRFVWSFFGAGRRWSIRVMAEAGTLLTFFMMLLVTADVTGRYAANHPLPGTFEIVSVLVPAIVFLGLAYAEYHKHHIRVEIFTEHLSPKARDAMNLFAWLLCAVLFGALTWYMSLEAVDALEVREETAGLITIPVYPVKWLMAIGTAFLTIEFIINIVNTIRKWLGHQAEEPASPPLEEQVTT